jgi:phage replication-related protein YjqB (UPF0714/DUF867 family)
MYSVDGTKNSGNSILHITSHKFDEPHFVRLAHENDSILAINRCSNRDDETIVWIGGADQPSASRLIERLSAARFPSKHDPSTKAEIRQTSAIADTR